MGCNAHEPMSNKNRGLWWTHFVRVRFINAWLVSGSKIKEKERMSSREKKQFDQIFNTTNELERCFQHLIEIDYVRIAFDIDI